MSICSKLPITFILLTLLVPATVAAQTFRPPPFGSNLDVTRSRIGDERVQRQTEVLRIERMLEAFETRLTRLERHHLRSPQLPAITIAEADAAVTFAKAQLQESEYQLEQGEASQADVARDRLALVRAQGQLVSASAAHQEKLLTLELDLVYAQRQMLQAEMEKEITERMAAKGYTSTETLKLVILNEELARKELQLAKFRVETQQKAIDSASIDPAESDSAVTDSAVTDSRASGPESDRGAASNADSESLNEHSGLSKPASPSNRQ